MPHIYALAGLKGAGKDTVAGIIERIRNRPESPCQTATVCFADPVKRMALQLGYPATVLWGASAERSWKHPETGVACRDVLKSIAVSLRVLNSDIWVKTYASTLSSLGAGGMLYRPARGLFFDRNGEVLLETQATEIVFTTDLRYPNEHACLKSGLPQGWSATTVLVRRPMPDDGDRHESEIWAREGAEKVVDVVLDNDGTLVDLVGRVRVLLRV